jgi:hypothetical protein
MLLFSWRYNPSWLYFHNADLAASFSRFLDHTQRHATFGRTPLDEWSIRCRDLYLTTHNTHNRQTSMPPVGFGHTISAGERPKTYALDRAATGTGTAPQVLIKTEKSPSEYASWCYQVFILSNGCTIKYSKKILKFTLKLTLKVLLHISD